MRKMNRRNFLKTSAAVTGTALAANLLPPGWYSLARAQSPAYFEREFGITDQLCRKILDKALSKGGDFADLYFEHSIYNTVFLEDGKVNRSNCTVELGVGIRTVKGDQVGYGFTQEFSEKSMLAAAGIAATIASGTPRPAAGQYSPLDFKNYYPLDQLLTDIPLASKLPLVEMVNEYCVARSPLLVKVRTRFYDEQKRMMLVTSEGIKAEDLLPRTYLSASVVAEQNGRQENAGWNIGGRYPFAFYTPDIARQIAHEAVDRALVMLEAIQPPAGEMPVVLGPGVTGVLLHEAIGHGMEADFNRKGISTYATMIGKKVAEPFVNIVDDGTNPGMLGALNVDDEGTPGQKTMLVEKGILTSYMHDKISARQYQVNPTGNGRRESYRHYIQPRMRNTYMLGGPAAREEVIAAAANGIYVKDVSNGEVKIGEGDFAFYVSQGNLIENGKLTAPIKDINIMGNGPKMLANIIMVAGDLEMCPLGTGYCGKGGQAVAVGFGLPTVLVKSLTVGGLKA